METLPPPQLELLLRDLPPAAAVLPRLLTLLAEPESSAEEVLELIRLDPGLAAAVLRASCSAFHGGRGRAVDSLEAAVAAIGFKETYRLVALHALAGAARAPLELYGESPARFWEKSVACALAMERLCGELGAPGTTGYTIGLLHALGEVLVCRLARAQGGGTAPLAFTPAEPLAAQELAAAGLTQAQAAAWALRHWQFPESLVEPIEYQFDPHEAPIHTQMALRLRLGKWLALLVLGDEAGARRVNPDFHFAITMPGNSFVGMVADLRTRLTETAGALHGTGCALA